MTCNAVENTLRFKVEVSVAAPEGPIGNRLESCIKKELRDLHDVTVNNDNPDYVINITALEVETEARNVIGIAIAVNTLEPYKSEEPSKVFPGSYRHLFVFATKGHYYDHGTKLIITSSNELPK